MRSLAALTVLLLHPVCALVAADFPPPEICPQARDGSSSGGRVRLSCDCFPKLRGTPASWWPLQEDARDFCGQSHGTIETASGGPAAGKFSPLGARRALDLETGDFVRVVDRGDSVAGQLDGMQSFSLAAVVRTSNDSQTLLSKALIDAGKQGDDQSYSFGIQNEHMVLEVFGERVGKRESCVRFRSNRRVNGSDLRRANGALMSVVWGGTTRAAFYVDRKPLGARLERSCKGSVSAVRDTATPLFLGAAARGGKNNAGPKGQGHFDGQMRDAVLYRRALEPREICQLADLLVPQPRPSDCASPGR